MIIKTKQFLRDCEQKIFDKNLADVKKLKHLKDLKKTAEVKKMTASVSNSDEFMNALFSETLS